LKSEFIVFAWYWENTFGSFEYLSLIAGIVLVSHVSRGFWRDIIRQKVLFSSSGMLDWQASVLGWFLGLRLLYYTVVSSSY
jgi:hypothetical protein